MTFSFRARFEKVTIAGQVGKPITWSLPEGMTKEEAWKDWSQAFLKGIERSIFRGNLATAYLLDMLDWGDDEQ